MHQELQMDYQKHVIRNRRKRTLKKIVSVLGCVVVFCTTYALILPAITMENTAFCGMEEHVHSEECCKAAAEKILVCGAESFEIHTHEAGCYSEEGVVTCATADYLIHSHDDSCYDAEEQLVCTLAERGAHIHEDSCYVPGETQAPVLHVHSESCYTPERGELLCTVEEYEGHAHDSNCYVVSQDLTCVLAENHVHGEGCYTYPLVCTQSTEPHAHGDGCYGTGNLLCGTQEYHVHGEGCMETYLSCTSEEEGHEHADGCYGTNVICSVPENHAHDGSCYETIVVCGLEAGAAHAHGEGCYSAEPQLICTEAENHIHDSACYRQDLVCVTPEDPGHAHGESCYQWNDVLSCGMEEGEPEPTEPAEPVLVCTEPVAQSHVHGEACFALTEPKAVTICGISNETHTHTIDCYEKTCGLSEHTHDMACWSDPEADVETPAVWEATFADLELTGIWNDDVIAIAETQLGYAESTLNYNVWEDGTLHGYTRYGHWYGSPYGDWCAMFTSFCLHYAEVEGIPLHWGVRPWIEELTELKLYHEAEIYQPQKGDIVFFDWEGDDLSDHVGLVAEVIPATDIQCAMIKAIEGNSANCVQYVYYDLDDPRILGYSELPDNIEVYSCGMLRHSHNEYCYDDYGTFICREREHQHTDTCIPREELYCGLSEHAHAEACYDAEGSLVCQLSSHSHTELCTVEAPVYYCGLDVHCHTETCYDEAGELICELAEHVHVLDCLTAPPVYYCGMEEHTHGETCYNEAGELVCETAEHTHSDACLTQEEEILQEDPSEIPTFYCGLSEHTHSETCYNEAGERICELTEHVHEELCLVAPPVYYCDLQEHAHDEACYNEAGELVCEITEHAHDELCLVAPPVYYCGLEEHIHGETCYNEAGELVCELTEHDHTEECLAEPTVYYCGMDEHTHGDACYDEAGELVCQLTEHTHSEECTYETVTYYCGLIEHTHDETCYDEAGELVCEITEHTHTDACAVPPVYLCGLEAHTHAEECYDEEGNLICTIPEHIHTQECTVISEYICGMQAHTHDERCYDAEGNLTCTIPEHTHTEDCKPRNAYACGMEEHTHGEACYDAEGNLICTIPEHVHTMACVGRDLYYSDATIRVHAAIRGVENLPRKLSLAAKVITAEENPNVVGSVQMAVNKQISQADQFVNATQVVDMQLISEGQIYELPETAIVTITMEFTEPIFDPAQIRNAVSTSGFIVVPEGGQAVLPQLTVEEEPETQPVETQPEEEPGLMDSVMGALTNVLDALAVKADADEIDLPPVETGAGDPVVEQQPEDPIDFQASAVTKEHYGNPDDGITSITFETNKISTFAVALADDSDEGNYWKRIDSINDISADKTYIIVSAEANLALTGDSSKNYRKVTVEAVKGNTNYYRITDDESNGADTTADKSLHWKFTPSSTSTNNNTVTCSAVQNVGTAGSYLTLSDSSTVLASTASSLILTAKTDAYSEYESAVAWTIRASNNNNRYLFYNYSNDTNFTVNNPGKTMESYRIWYGILPVTISISNDSQGNMLIFELVTEQLTIPTDVTIGSDDLLAGENGQMIVKPDYENIQTPSGAKTGEDKTSVSNDDGTQNVVGSYYSDAATSDIEKNFRKESTDAEKNNEGKVIGSEAYYALHTPNNGRVLTDKSVIYQHDDYEAFTSYDANTFGVTLSALGQAYQLPGEQQVTIPVDVVFILDTSGSMRSQNTSNVDRLGILIEAANKSIDYILNGSDPCYDDSGKLVCTATEHTHNDTCPDNCTTTVHIHMTAEQIQERHGNNRVGVATFSSGAGQILPLSRPNPNNSGQYIYASNNVIRSSTGTVQGLTDGGTFTQAGIQAGYKIFETVANAEDTNFTFTLNGEEKTVPRQPVFVLLSDGEPTHCSNIYNDPMRGPYYGNSEMDVDNAKGILGYYTVLSANYFKRMVGNLYNNTADFYTIGMGIQETGSADADDTDENDYYKRAVLDPSPERLSNANDQYCNHPDETLRMMRSLLNGTFDSTKDFVSVYADVVYYAGFFDAGDRYIDSNSNVPILRNHPYTGNYNYADDAYFGEYDADELEEIFNGILDTSLKARQFGFILYENQNDVTMTDRIGEGMEVKGAPKLHYDGKLYTATDIQTGVPTTSTSKDGNTVTTTTVTTYTYAHNHNLIYSNTPKNLSRIHVTVTTDVIVSGTGEDQTTKTLQTVQMVVPDDTLPVYTPEENNSLFYYEALPVRLIYQVGLTEEGKQQVLSMNEDGVNKLEFYTNRWQGEDDQLDADIVADSQLLPDTHNPHYFNEDGSLKVYDHEAQAKVGETTDTYEYVVSCIDTRAGDNNETILIDHTLGNNGKLVFEPDSVDIPVEKVWDEDIDNPPGPITVNLYQVIETTPGNPEVDLTKPIKTLVLDENEDEKLDWKGTFENLAPPTATKYYAIGEVVPDGFQELYSGTGITPLQILRADGKRITLAVVKTVIEPTVDDEETEDTEDTETPGNTENPENPTNPDTPEGSETTEGTKVIITNVPSVEMPQTGGAGLTPYHALGILLCSVACALYIIQYTQTKRKGR